MNIRTLTFTIFLLLWAALGTALAVVPPLTSLTLAWEKAPSHGTNISYVLKWGPQLGGTNFALNVGTNLTCVVTNPTTGFLYFHVVARTHDGLESDPSNVISVTNYPAQPVNLRMTTNTTTSLRIEGTTDGNSWIHLATVNKDNAPVLIPSASKMMLRTVQLPPLP